MAAPRYRAMARGAALGGKSSILANAMVSSGGPRFANGTRPRAPFRDSSPDRAPDRLALYAPSGDPQSRVLRARVACAPAVRVPCARGSAAARQRQMRAVSSTELKEEVTEEVTKEGKEMVVLEGEEDR